MNVGRTVFAQLIAYLSHIEFQKCVARDNGDRYHRRLSCWDQYLTMAFAQLTYRESLRDIEACLQFMGSKLYHAGLLAPHWPMATKPTTGVSSLTLPRC